MGKRHANRQRGYHGVERCPGRKRERTEEIERGVPNRALLAIAGTPRLQPAPTQLFPAPDRYARESEGCIPAVPGGRAIGRV